MIRPTFLAFETAKRALNISQAGLDIVGHNISNAQTTGYTRQRVDQVSMTMNGISSKYMTFGANYYGSGATLNGISQIRDPYLDNRYRTEATKNGELGIRSEGLTDINNIFDETLSDGLSAKMSELLDTLTVLGQSANIKEHAAVFRDTAKAFASILNKNYSQLEEARALQMSDLKTTAEKDVNAILSKIADLNKMIKEDNFYGNPSNELNDERNMLIDNLSEYFDINVVRTPTTIAEGLVVETVDIELKNSGDPPLKLVEGQFHNKIGVTQDAATGNAIVSLLDGISGLPIEKDLSSILTSGGVKGYLDIINGEGPNSGGANSYRGIPYYMKALDEYAQQFAEILNRVNNITEQEAQDSGVSYAPVISGTATDWLSSIQYGNIKGVDYGAIDFGGKNTNMSFAYDDVANEITATFNDENGNPQTFTAEYVENGDIQFLLPSGEYAYSGSAGTWVDSVTSGTFDFDGKSTDISFEYDSVSGDITATIIDGSGTPQTFTGAYDPSDPSAPINFSGPAGDFSVTPNGTAPPDGVSDSLTVGNIAFTLTTLDATPPLATTEEPTTEVLVDAGWPPLTATNGNKNLIVPQSPVITDSEGKKPSWIDTIKGGVIQFSGQEYDIEFGYDSATGAMTAKMADGTEYAGTYSPSGKIDFRDADGSVMFTVNTTAEAPDASTSINLDATITAKNISISQNWSDDPLYITTSKNNATNMKTAALVLEGTKNPTWLNKVTMGPDAVAVPNASYQFAYTNDPPKTDAEGNKEIFVTIGGIKYSGYYKTNSTVELKGGDPEKVGLILDTNHKAFGTTDAENVATIRNDAGAANDNINRLLTEMNRNVNYSTSGINGNLQTFLTSLQAQMGLDQNVNTSLLEASLTSITTLANRRDSVSAVSIDEEGINMMTYQNYYNAAARYMTTIDEALDKIINGMGTVGR